MAEVDISKISNDRCSCGWQFYRKRTIIKRISRIIAATQDDMMVVKEFLVCEKCGKPHESSMAEFVALVEKEGMSPEQKQEGHST